MSENNYENSVDIMYDAIKLLENAINKMQVKIGAPLFLPEEGKPRYRYGEKSAVIIQLLKAVRIVSGLNASMVLLEKGFIQEIGVLIRTIKEFMTDIDFLQEGIDNGKFNKQQEKFIKDFFEKDLQTPEELMAEKQSYVPRRKKRASLARIYEKYDNFNRIREIYQAIDLGFDGYIHGYYPHIMELYEGSYNGTSEGFVLDGTTLSIRKESWRQQISIDIHGALNIINLIAKNLGLTKLADELQDKRKNFENSLAFNKKALQQSKRMISNKKNKGKKT
jgi:hypothetical protein